MRILLAFACAEFAPWLHPGFPTGTRERPR